MPTIFARGTYIEIPDEFNGIPVLTREDVTDPVGDETARIVVEAGLFFTSPRQQEFALHFQLDAPLAAALAFSADPMNTPAPVRGTRYIALFNVDDRQRPVPPTPSRIREVLTSLTGGFHPTSTGTDAS